MAIWDSTYKEHGMVQHTVRSDIVEMANVFRREQSYGKLSKYKVLDHCCGTGRHVRYLAEKGFYVVGLDNSQEALKITIEEIKGFGNVRLVLSEMDEIPFSDKYFNAAISILGLHFGSKDQRENAIRSVHRILKKGSPFYLSVISKNHDIYGLGTQVKGDPDTYQNIPDIHVGSRHFYDAEELEKILTKIGFDIVSMKEYTEPLKDGSFFKHPLYEWRVLAKKK